MVVSKTIDYVNEGWAVLHWTVLLFVYPARVFTGCA